MAKSKKPERKALMVEGQPVILDDCSVTCKAFEFCIQPHVCEKYDKCIWGPTDVL